MPQATQDIDNQDLPPMEVRGVVKPSSFNSDDGTVEVEYTAGARVLRYGYIEKHGYDSYYEELSTKKGHVRLDRLKNGSVPVLDSHSSYRLENIIGTVLEGDETHAKVKFSNRDSLKDLRNDIKEGVVRNISVGYRVHKYEDVTKDDDDIRVLRAVDWEPFEISFVAIPADSMAGVRSATKTTNKCIITRENSNKPIEENNIMPNTITPEAVDPTTRAVGTPPVPAVATIVPATRADDVVSTQNPQADIDAAIVDERKRANDIMIIGRKANVEETVLQKLVDDGVSVESARGAILDVVVAAQETRSVNPNIEVKTPEGQLSEMQRKENYVLYRANPSANPLNEQAREYIGNSLIDIAKDALGKEARGLNKNEIAIRAMHSTSDFPDLLANVASKSLRDGYDNTQRSFMPFCTQGTLPDFKEMKRVALSNVSSLGEVVEDAEYKRATFSDGAETIQLSTYGKIIAITRQMIINDDLSGVTRIPQKLAAAAGRLENAQVYDILKSNPVMVDGQNLFSAAHKNQGNQSLNVAGVGALRALMRVQTDPSGNDLLNLAPKFIIVPAALETLALQLFGPLLADSAGNVNPYAGKHEIIVEGLLDATSASNFFMAADPSQIDTIEYSYLEGQTAPYLETRDTFTRDGMEMKVRHDFATKAIDHRGLVKSTN